MACLKLSVELMDNPSTLCVLPLLDCSESVIAEYGMRCSHPTSYWPCLIHTDRDGRYYCLQTEFPGKMGVDPKL